MIYTSFNFEGISSDHFFFKWHPVMVIFRRNHGSLCVASKIILPTVDPELVFRFHRNSSGESQTMFVTDLLLPRFVVSMYGLPVMNWLKLCKVGWEKSIFHGFWTRRWIDRNMVQKVFLDLLPPAIIVVYHSVETISKFRSKILFFRRFRSKYVSRSLKCNEECCRQEIGRYCTNYYEMRIDPIGLP